MELALPRFEGLGDGPRQVHRPWMVSNESPASPDPGGLTELLLSSSPCLNLDVLSSDDTEGSVGLSNISVTLLCGSDDGHAPVNSYQVLSDEDLPPEAGLDDRRQVIQIRDISPDVQIVDISQVGRVWNSRRTVSKGGSGKQMPLPVCILATTTSGRDLDDALGLSASRYKKFISQSNDMYIIMYKCITEYYYDYNGNGRSTITYIGCLPDAPGKVIRYNKKIKWTK